MSSNRIWVFGTIVVIAVLLGGSWMLGISPRLTEAAVANMDREAVALQNEGHEATLAGLKLQVADIELLKEQLAAMQLAMPNAAALPELISQLNARAVTHGVVITSITITDPIPYIPESSTSADPELVAAAVSVTDENFLGISVNMTVTGPYAQAMDFIADVQAGERLFLLHDLSLTEGTMSGDSAVILSATGQVFVLLDPSQIPAAPAAPDAGPVAG